MVTKKQAEKKALELYGPTAELSQDMYGKVLIINGKLMGGGRKTWEEVFKNVAANLARERRIFNALHWTVPVEPDVPIPERGETKGFLYVNGSTPGIRYARSRSTSHIESYDERYLQAHAATWTQGGKRLYSTKLRALQALRRELEREAAARLAAVDEQIEDEMVNSTTVPATEGNARRTS